MRNFLFFFSLQNVCHEKSLFIYHFSCDQSYGNGQWKTIEDLWNWKPPYVWEKGKKCFFFQARDMIVEKLRMISNPKTIVFFRASHSRQT